MVKNFETLVSLCDEELRHREYAGNCYGRLTAHWEKLGSWLSQHNITELSEVMGNSYLEDEHGILRPVN